MAKFSKLPRLYYKNSLKINDFIYLDKEYINYLKNVLRLNLNSQLRLFNAQDGEYLTEIHELHKKEITLKVIKQIRKLSQDNSCLTLIIAAVKNDKLAQIIRQATECGVNKIMIWYSEFSQNNKINFERLNKIITEAAEQSESMTLPELQQLNELNDLTQFQQLIFANEQEQQNNILNIELKSKNIALIIGPEGGFSDNEQNLLRNFSNSVSVSLGEQVLRAETAAISASFILKQKLKLYV